MGERRLIASGGPWEDRAGYSRAVVVGNACHVSGTTDAGADGVSGHPGDIAAQAEATLEIIREALDRAGFGIDDVVRTRMYVTSLDRLDSVLEVHRRWFDAVRPAATIVRVAGLIEPTVEIEIEVDAER